MLTFSLALACAALVGRLALSHDSPTPPAQW